MTQPTVATRPAVFHPSYEIFILGLSIFSIANVLVLLLPFDPEVHAVVDIIDTVVSLVFLADFTYRLVSAPSRLGYLRWGWLDLLGSLPAPGFRLFRVFRVVRAFRSLQAIGGPGVVRDLLRDRGATAIFIVILLTIVVIEIAAIFMLLAERDHLRANIRTGGDALWWAVVSVTTVGYGDLYPVTPEGRIVGVFLLALGIGLFSTFTGFIATRLTARVAEPRSMTPATPPESPVPPSAKALEYLGTVGPTGAPAGVGPSGIAGPVPPSSAGDGAPR